MKLRITILKYHSWYLCQISLQVMLLPILMTKKRVCLKYQWYIRVIRELKQRRRQRQQKTSPRKRIRAVSNFIALIPTPLICQMLAIFQELNSKVLYLSSQKRREIRKFQVVIVQWRKEIYTRAWCTCKVVVECQSQPSQPIVHFFAVLVDVIVVVAGLSTGLLFMIKMRVSYGVR